MKNEEASEEICVTSISCGRWCDGRQHSGVFKVLHITPRKNIQWPMLVTS